MFAVRGLALQAFSKLFCSLRFYIREREYLAFWFCFVSHCCLEACMSFMISCHKVRIKEEP